MVDAKAGDKTPKPTKESISISDETTAYKGYADTLAFYKRKAKDCPKGVRLKLQKGKFLMLQFTLNGKTMVKASGESFTDNGIVNAVNKTWVISDNLTRFNDVAEFWAWYDETILGKKELTNDAKTYRQIFAELENRYFSGKHKNTKRKRSRESQNDLHSFKAFYGNAFSLFTDWNDYPSVSGFKDVVAKLTLGSKSAKDTCCVLKKIAELSHDAKRITEYLSSIDFSQNIYAEKQSIDYSTLLRWFKSIKAKALTNPNKTQGDKTLAWLWVSAMGVIYGLRPSEVMAAQNIDKAYTVDGVTFPAITDSSNKAKLLYLGDFTLNGCSIKTGKRVCLPLCNESTVKELEIEQFHGLPHIKSSKSTAIQCVYSHFLRNHSCPVTQAYAFRHLSNQMGEMNGIPQEIRARSLGHSVAVNESVYKKRSNLKTSVDILTNHPKQQLPLDLALSMLQDMGVDTDNKSVKLILKVIYQIPD